VTAKAAERHDPRPQIPAPLPDAPWIPQMQVLNDVLGASPATEPPMRDIDGVVTMVRVRRIPNMHTLTAETVNEGEAQKTLPAPEQPLLTRLDEIRLSELIEAHIDYVNHDGQSVHLAGPFVPTLPWPFRRRPPDRVGHRDAADRDAGMEHCSRSTASIANEASSFAYRRTCWPSFSSRPIAHQPRLPPPCAS